VNLAFSSAGMDLDSEIDPRFGRCAYFLFVNPDDMTFEAVENESMSLGGGAGIQSGQFIASKGAQVVITGSVGPNASRTLNAAGVDVILGVSGPIRVAIERYKKGELSPTDQPNAPDHYGMGMQKRYTPNQGSSVPSSNQDLGALKDEAKAVRDQLDSILARIKDLEGK
jgi:predicted Fe-Mo cluster-binding NifX family protein